MSPIFSISRKCYTQQPHVHILCTNTYMGNSMLLAGFALWTRFTSVRAYVRPYTASSTKKVKEGVQFAQREREFNSHCVFSLSLLLTC